MTQASQTSAERVNGLLAKLDGSGSEDEWAAADELRTLGLQLPPILRRHYQHAKKAGTRAACVFHCIRYARVSADAVALGLDALKDRSKAVRYRACQLLAWSQAKEALPGLRAALRDSPRSGKEDLVAAIDALEAGNPNFFVDREHTGRIAMNFE